MLEEGGAVQPELPEACQTLLPDRGGACHSYLIAC